MSQNLEVALALKIAQTGLENIQAVIKQLRSAGLETSEFESSAQTLSTTMQRVAQERGMIEQFKNLWQQTKDSEKALADIQARTRELAIELRNTESPTKRQQQAFERSRAAARQASEAYQANRLTLQNLRGSLSEAGISTTNLAQHQVDLNRQTQSLESRQATLADQVGQLAQKVGASSSNYDQAITSQTRLAQTAEQASNQLTAAGNRLRQDTQQTIGQLQSAGVETQQLESEVDQLANALHAAGQQQALISTLVQLEQTTDQSRRAMDQADAQVQSLTETLRQSAAPTREQSDVLARAKQAAADAADAYKRNQQAVDKLSGELQKAGVDTDNLALKQKDLKQTTERLDAQQQSLVQRLKAEALAMNQASKSADAVQKSHRKIGEGVRSISEELAVLRQGTIAYFALDFGTQLLQGVTDLTDGYTDLTSRIRLAVGGGQAFNQALEEVRQSANATGTSLESVGDLYTKLNRSTRELGTTQEDVAQLTDTISKSFVISGTSAQEADGAITQLAQGLGSGVLRGDEFNSVMEQSPRLAQAMADSLGVTTGELRKMAEEGKLTTATVVSALQQQADAIEQEFDQMPDTVGRATQRLTNEWQLFLGELNETTGASELAVSALNGIAENLDQIAVLAGTAATVGAAALAVKYTPAVIAATREMVTAAATGNVFAGSLSTVEGQAGKTSNVVGLLKDGIVTAITAVAIQQAINLANAYSQLQDATEALNATNEALEESQADLAERYREISEQTGVVVSNMRELDQAIDDGRIVIDHATSSYLSAADAKKLMAERAEKAAQGAQEQVFTWKQYNETLNAVSKSVAKASDKTRDQKQAAEELSDSLDKQLNTAMKSGADAIAGFVGGVIKAQSETEKADELIDNWIKSLNSTELNQFQFVLQSAFESGTISAKTLAEYTEKTLATSFENLGISAAIALNKISPAAENALTDLDNITLGVQHLAVDADQQMQVVEQAILGAIPKAETTADIDAISSRLETLEKSGRLGADGVSRVTVELTKQKAQILQTIPGIQSIEEAWANLGITSQVVLDQQAADAKASFEVIKNSGASLDEVSKAFAAYAEKAITANDGVADSALKAQAEIYGVTEKINGLGDSSADAADKTDKAAESIDHIGRAAKSTAQDIQDVTQSTGNYTNQLNGFASQLGDYYSNLKNTLRDLVSDEGVAEFERIMSKGASYSDDMTAGLDALGLAAAKAREEMSGLRSNVASLTDFTGFSSWAADAKLAFNEIIIAADEARQSNEDLEESIEDVGNTATDTSMTVAVMANTDLTPLVNSAEDVEQAMENMRDSAASALSSIQQDLWRLQGDQAAINEANYRARAAELELDLQAARASGNSAAVADLEKALLLLEQYRDMQRESEREAQLEAKESAVDQKIDDLGDQHKSELEYIDQQRQVEQTRFDRGQIDQRLLEWRLSELDRRATNTEIHYQAMLTQLERERDRVRVPVHSPAANKVESPQGLNRNDPDPIPERPPENRYASQVVKVVDVRLGNRTVQVPEGQEETLLDMLEDAALRGAG